MRAISRRKQRPLKARPGYSLIEVLIAAVIAAGVVSAAAGAVGEAARLKARASTLNELAETAATLTARLRAGFSDEETLKGFKDWTIERAPYKASQEASLVDGEGLPAFERVTLKAKGERPYAIELIVLRRART